MSDAEQKKLNELLAHFASEDLEPVELHLFEEQTLNKKGFLPKLSLTALNAVTAQGKEIATLYETLRNKKENGKVLWGVIAGNRNFSGQIVDNYHHIVALVDCRVKEGNIENGYIAIKYWKTDKEYKDGTGAKVFVRCAADISDDMLVQRKKWSVAVEGFLVGDTEWRSCFEPGILHSDGTCDALTCRDPACVASRQAAGKASSARRIKEVPTLEPGARAGGAGGVDGRAKKSRAVLSPPVELPLLPPETFQVVPMEEAEMQHEIWRLDDENLAVRTELFHLKAQMVAKEEELAASVQDCRDASDTLLHEANAQEQAIARFDEYRKTVVECVAKMSRAADTVGPHGFKVVTSAKATSSGAHGGGRKKVQDTLKGKQPKGMPPDE